MAGKRKNPNQVSTNKLVYIEEDTKQELKRFLFSTYDDSDPHKAKFESIQVVGEKAFYEAKEINKLLFDDKLRNIKKQAFSDMENLELFCCGKIDSSSTSIKNFEIAKLESPANADGKQTPTDFIIETSAFSGCSNLQTVILPACDILEIEKSAFAGCSSLRTVVCFAKKIDFTENPFGDCNENLTFVGETGSAIARFARENGYRFVNA